ncbi:hypothetical protein [Streptomyces sp. NPDC008141]|uniref:hypothetical protein n=1 Tax=Streptomyces sp. NPDC008141 TaxID=3364815 RepID=UPI0036EE3C54
MTAAGGGSVAVLDGCRDDVHGREQAQSRLIAAARSVPRQQSRTSLVAWLCEPE